MTGLFAIAWWVGLAALGLFLGVVGEFLYFLIRDRRDR